MRRPAGRAALRCGALLVPVLLGACSMPAPRQPGDILQAEPFAGAPTGSTATRVLYASTAPDGSPITVSGFVVVPSGDAPPGGRPVVAWLHPTTGVDNACAPSTGPAPFGQIQGLAKFLAAGDVVVATDYPGLGNPGVHPYLVGASEARAALDSVRAAQHLPDARAGSAFAVWGHSQGGQAALFTASLAASYAPELRLVGTAAAAPVTNLAAMVGQPGQNPLWGALLAYTISSWSQVLGVTADGIAPGVESAVIERTARDCLETGIQLKQLLADAAPLHGTRVAPDAQWRDLLAANAPQPPDTATPVLFAQGSDDPVIPPSLTRDYAIRLCTRHIPVRYLAMPGVDHYRIALLSADAVATWIAGRFAGAPMQDDCAALMRHHRG